MKNLRSRSKVFILVRLVALNGLYSIVVVTASINPPISSSVLTATFRSSVLFPTPLPFGYQLPPVLVNHSIYYFGIWTNTSNLENNILRFDFNSNFTTITHIKQYNMTFLQNEHFLTNYSFEYVITDGQQLYFLTNSRTNFTIFIVNLDTLTVTQTYFGGCSVGTIAPIPFNFCSVVDMALWNDSLWQLEDFEHHPISPDNGSVITYSFSSVTYKLPSFTFEANYTLSESAALFHVIFGDITSLPSEGITSLSNILLLNGPIFGFALSEPWDSYAFDPSTHTLAKIICNQDINTHDANEIYHYYPVGTSFLTASGNAIEFLFSPFDSECILGFTTWTIAPTIPPFPLLPLVFNMSMYIVIVLIFALDKNMKNLGKSLIERI